MIDTAVFASDRHRLQISPVGFRLIDDLNGDVPIGPLSCLLDMRLPSGDWASLGARGQLNAGRIVIFPGLGRVARRGLSGAAPTTFRARFSADFYVPFYRTTQDGLSFDVFPFNDEEPPPNLTGIPIDVVLTPAPAYPFPGDVRVLRGVVADAAGPVPDVEVVQGNVERVLTDARGCYALPLRQPPYAGNLEIDATHQRSGRVGQVTVTLPDALGSNQTIEIN